MLLDICDRTGTGILSMIWPFAEFYRTTPLFKPSCFRRGDPISPATLQPSKYSVSPQLDSFTIALCKRTSTHLGLRTGGKSKASVVCPVAMAKYYDHTHFLAETVGFGHCKTRSAMHQPRLWGAPLEESSAMVASGTVPILIELLV